MKNYDERREELEKTKHTVKCRGGLKDIADNEIANSIDEVIEQPKQTNFDRIKAMSVEELAEFLNDMQNDALFLEGTIHDLKYPADWKEYLESEVEGE